MSDVIFGQSYYLRFDPKLHRAMQPYAPLGSLYAASYLRSRGYSVGFFDAMLAASEDEWDTRLDVERPRYAVLYEDNFNYLSKMCLLRMRSAAFAMIEAARARACTVIVAGSDATDHAGLYLQRGAHYVLRGEGEVTLGALLDHLSGRVPSRLEAVDGLAFADAAREDGVVQTRPRADLQELDALPFPAWDLVDVDRYAETWRRRHGAFSMNVVTTRGCPYHCNWCAKPIWGQRYNVRSPDNVVAELAWLRETYDPDHISFADDIFGLQPGWIRRFADLLAERSLAIPFKCLSRADLLLRDGEIDELRRAGCRSVWIGAESGSQEILDAMEKGLRVDEIREAARRAHAAGIEIGFFLQFGYPGETRRHIEETLGLVRECQPDDVGVSVSYPLPGTRFHDAVRAELGAKRNWIDSDDLDALYEAPFSTAFYRTLRDALHKELRAARLFRELPGLARRPSTIRRAHLRRAAAALYGLCTLPLERRRLDRLAGEAPARPAQRRGDLLRREAAARPTPQA
jgi:anaerobic magnesium-protoporphyrin IX monomethyl ester cyclase